MLEKYFTDISERSVPVSVFPNAKTFPIGRELIDGFLFKEECVDQLIREQALHRPNAPAVCAAQQTISYGELEGRSNRLARRLLSMGVSKRTVIALCVERSPALVVSALAILKAGAAYLPMDPSYPVQRLRYILQDAKVPVVLSHENMVSQLSGGPWKVFDVNHELAMVNSYPSDPVECNVRPEDSAYVIYTSGSTGQPKGVEVAHRNLLNLINWHHRAFNLTQLDRATLLSSPSFDATVWELWPYLVAGASIHICDEAMRFSPEQLKHWFVENQISMAFVPTPLAERLITFQWPESTALRFLLTGGDTLQRFPRPGLPFAVANNYGPTECTVVATSGIVSAEERQSSSPSIGRPISNVQVHILDENLRPVAEGETGEICIGGAGVSKGYLNHPELTAEKFVPDLFSAQPGATLYKTGDRARFLPDGQIEFLGRMDEQVKIRGFRIEPNEIAGVLLRHPSVEASVVIALTNSHSEKELVAYVVSKENKELSEESLRQHVREFLPEYMVPSICVRLDSLPLTPNGKVDRHALPHPDTSNTIRSTSLELARSPLEAQLAKIVSKLLELEQVGVNDNFFLIGGHSLLGTQLIAHIRDSFGVELTLRSLFDNPTIAGISAEIESAANAAERTAASNDVRRQNVV